MYSESCVDDGGYEGDDDQEYGPHKGDACHGIVEVFGGGFSWADAHDDAAVFFHVVGHFDGGVSPLNAQASLRKSKD